MTVAYTMSPVHAPRIVGHFALCDILLDAGLMRRLAVVYGYGVAIAGDCLGAASVFFEMRCHDGGGGGGAMYNVVKTDEDRELLFGCGGVCVRERDREREE